MRKIVTLLWTTILSLFVTTLAHAETIETVVEVEFNPLLKPALAIAAGLAIGLAAFGGSLGQGRAAQGALEGIARNPGAASKIQTPMIIALALIESLVIYALVIAFLLQGRI